MTASSNSSTTNQSNQIEALISAEAIQQRIAELANEINHDYANKSIMLLGTLKGAYIFMADLSRMLTSPVEIEFIRVSSYGDSTTSAEVRCDYISTTDMEGKHVLVVEDIIDTGKSLVFLHEYIKGYNPASVRYCALLDKPSRRQVVTPACDYIGFTIPDEFVVGYGLDYAQQHRYLPYIGILSL